MAVCGVRGCVDVCVLAVSVWARGCGHGRGAWARGRVGVCECECGSVLGRRCRLFFSKVFDFPLKLRSFIFSFQF